MMKKKKKWKWRRNSTHDDGCTPPLTFTLTDRKEEEKKISSEWASFDSLHNEIASLLAGAHLVIGDIFGRAAWVRFAVPGLGYEQEENQTNKEGSGTLKEARKKVHTARRRTKRLAQTGSSLNLERCDMNCLRSTRYARYGGEISPQ